MLISLYVQLIIHNFAVVIMIMMMMMIVISAAEGIFSVPLFASRKYFHAGCSELQGSDCA